MTLALWVSQIGVEKRDLVVNHSVTDQSLILMRKQKPGQQNDLFPDIQLAVYTGSSVSSTSVCYLEFILPL